MTTNAATPTDLRGLLGGGWPAGLADGELVRRYLEGDRAEADLAFEVLVRRHGPMVLSLCRRLTHDEHLAADVFQATFLALSRRASMLRRADSLAPWLRRVARRIGGKAWARARRLRAREAPLVEVAAAVVDPEAVELREVVSRELAGLPSRYRSALILCELEGMPHQEAAGLMGVAVGTVGSRLSRGRALLRGRLARRGFGAAAVLGVWPRASLSAELLGRTLAAVEAGGVVPPAVEAMARGALRGMLMGKLTIGLAMVAVGTLGLGGLSRLAVADDPPKPAAAPVSAPKPPSLKDRFDGIVAEYKVKLETYSKAVEVAQTAEEQQAAYSEFYPSELDYTGRILALAESAPADPVAGEAARWVVSMTLNNNARGPQGEIERRAMELIVDHHADEAKSAWITLGMTNLPSANREYFAEAMNYRATSHVAKGATLLGLARYTGLNARLAQGKKADPKPMVIGFMVAGKKREMTLPEDEAAEHRARYERDPEPLRLRAVELFEEVVAGYVDVPYGKGGKTLASLAANALEEFRAIQVGQPAPAFAGVSVNGDPIRLDDFKGKVVFMVFWGSWCGPCMAEAPHERELAERYKGRPFTMLGINVDATPAEAKKAIDAEQMAWPHLFDGDTATARVVQRYNVASYPMMYVVDAQGSIRLKGHMPPDIIDPVIDRLVKEQEARLAATAHPAPATSSP